MPELLEHRVVDLIQQTLRSAGSDPQLVVGPDDSMETVAGWDSLSFMTVFLAVNDEFDLSPDFDDAVHYMAVPSLIAYLETQLP